MNNFATEQDCIMLCNFHSKRWKTRRKQAASDKMIIALYKELQSLWHIISNMEYEELEVPIQKGFKRHFELNKSIEWKDDTDFFQGILDKINSVQYSKDKQFKKVRSKRLGKYKYKKRGNPMLLDLTERQFKTLSEKEKWYFYPIKTYYSDTKLWITRYRFIETWRFEICIRPNMLTKIQKRNWEAEHRKDELETFFFTKRNFIRAEKTRRAYKYWLKDEWYYRPPLDNPLLNKPLHKVMEEYNEEKQLWAYNQKN